MPGADVRAGARAAYEALAESAQVLHAVAREWSAWADTVAEDLARRLEAGGQLLTCGNGGSAAAAPHIAAELPGALYLAHPAAPPRRSLPATAAAGPGTS